MFCSNEILFDVFVCVLSFFAVSIAVFPDSLALPCIPITPISTESCESAGVASLRKLVRISGVHVCIVTTGKV